MQIDKDIPIPKIKRYSFATMDVGDSIFCVDMADAERVSSAAYSYAKAHDSGFRVIRRKVEDGYRVWRVA